VGPDLRGAFLQPIRELIGPDHRVYLPFVATSFALAAVVWLLRRGRGSAPLLRYLVPWRLFLHRSSRFDARWLVVRALAHAVIAWPVKVTVVGTMLFVSGHLRDVVGSPPWDSPKDRALVVAAFTLVTFVADDFTRFLLHLAMHRVPALWELHKVHHSAEVLTPLTLYRVHPLESVANNLRGTLTLGACAGLFAWALPGRLSGWEILGVDALGFAWTALGSNLRHSHVWMTWGPLERLFVSPAQHQLHHGRSESTWNKNFGSALAIWDLAFGTLLLARGRRPPRVGLSRAERNHGLDAVSALVDPVVAAARALARPWARARSARPDGERAPASPRAPKTEGSPGADAQPLRRHG